ncbi:MAG: MerC domain-containing protein [Planctomycetales bacterium]
MKVELIYDSDCPNVEEAKRQLRRALAEAGRPAEWTEWERSDPGSPPHVRGYGSPTILVDGGDVAGATPSNGAACCRLYSDGSGRLRGVPTVGSIASALTRHGTQRASRSWLSSVPAVFVAVLPNLTCPACWPAYAALLSALGLPFVNYTPFLAPLTVAALVLAVAGLAFRARTRRGYGPFFAGLAAAGLVILGRFVTGSLPVMYAGIAILIAASIWNSWPRRKPTKACPACVQGGTSANVITDRKS